MSGKWKVETLNAAVDAELSALPADMRARFIRIAELIATSGLEHVGMPYVKPVRPPLWEIRLSGKAGIARALYVTDRRVVVLRVFAKKTPRIPKREMELALERARQLRERSDD